MASYRPKKARANIFPCGYCEKDVSWNWTETEGEGAVCCDECEVWYHRCCHSLSVSRFKRLDEEIWRCYKCLTFQHNSFSYHSYEYDYSNDSHRATNLTPMTPPSTVNCSLGSNSNDFQPNHHSTPENRPTTGPTSSPAEPVVLPCTATTDTMLSLSSTTRSSRSSPPSLDMPSDLSSESKNSSGPDSITAVSSTKNWRTLVLNANGLNMPVKKAALANLLDYVKPDAVIITETNLSSSTCSSEVIPPGYLENKPLRHNRSDRSNEGGGVLLAVKDGYTLSEITLPPNPAEIVWGEVKLQNGKSLVIGGYYRTPSGHAVTQQEEFDRSLSDLKSLYSDNSILIIGGDFNLKDIDWETGFTPPGAYQRQASQLLIDTLDNHQLTQVQRETTREKSVLDLYITNRPSLVKAINVTPNISDHDAAIVADSDIYPLILKKKPRSRLIFSKANWAKMKEEAATFSEKYICSHLSRTVNENWETIKSEINSISTSNIPTSTKTSNKKNPWSTRDLVRKSRKKHRMYKRAKRSKDPKKMDKYKKFQKEVRSEVRRTRNNYINEHIVGGLKDGNTKPFYTYIKSLRNDSVGLAHLKTGGNLVTSPSEKAEILLKEFSSVFTNEDTECIPWLGPATNNMSNIVVTTDGVEKLLETLQPHKASGPDRIPNRILKELSTEIAPIFTALFNQSLTTGTIPNDWSNALISPVYKKGNVHQASNYRPVSLTSVACKLLEHIVCSHIHAHLDRHQLLTPVQHGFRKKHSCESQLLITLDDFHSSFDTKTQTDVGVLDFSRAFDTVPHQRLISKLAHYGIQGTTLNWITAFLENRKMQVVVDGEMSKSAPVTSGVPQGTVLGPLLFNLYINDMPDTVTEGTKIRLFADDCLAYREVKTLADQQILQEDLHSLEEWAIKWGMRFNAAKCQIMHIARTKAVTKYYELCGQMLDTVGSAKYLGIIISQDLQWNEQVCSASKKASSTLHLIARNLRCCPRATRVLAYTTLVRPKLEYSASVWDPHKKEDVNTLEKVNRRAARVVYRKSFRQQGVSPTSLLQRLGWDTLEKRRQDQRLEMMFKICHGLIAIPPTRLHKRIRQLRGHSLTFQVATATCDTTKFAFYCRTIPQWNALPHATAEASNLDIFKSQLRA